MEQTRLPFAEDEVLHLVDVAVNAAGGPKEVGSRIKPDMDPEEAGKWINRCTNPRHKDQLMATYYIRTLLGARYRNNHDAINELLRFCGYIPNAIPQTTEAQEASLMQQILDAQAKINDTVEKMAEVRRRERGEW